MLKKLTPKNILAFLILVGSLVWLAVWQFPDNRLHLIFCDVGQGDATLITKGFNQILVDGGPNDKVLACLKNNLPFWDKTIEIVALTHPEADHMTGLLSVLDKYEVKYFLAGPESGGSAVFEELVKKLEGFCKASPCSIARGGLMNVYSGDKIKLGDITLDSLWPSREFVINNVETQNFASLQTNDGGAVLGAKTTHTKLNDFSLVFLLEYANKKILLMADADSQTDDKIVLNSISLPIDILKFPHHGSKTGMKEDFLGKIKPKEAVISVGRNSYGHPTMEALDLLKEFNVIIRRTDLEGEIKYTF